MSASMNWLLRSNGSNVKITIYPGVRNVEIKGPCFEGDWPANALQFVRLENSVGEAEEVILQIRGLERMFRVPIDLSELDLIQGDLELSKYVTSVDGASYSAKLTELRARLLPGDMEPEYRHTLLTDLRLLLEGTNPGDQRAATMIRNLVNRRNHEGLAPYSTDAELRGEVKG